MRADIELTCLPTALQRNISSKGQPPPASDPEELEAYRQARRSTDLYQGLKQYGGKDASNEIEKDKNLVELVGRKRLIVAKLVDDQKPLPEISKQELKMFDGVEKEHSAQKGWLAVDGLVYDVTSKCPVFLGQTKPHSRGRQGYKLTGWPAMVQCAKERVSNALLSFCGGILTDRAKANYIKRHYPFRVVARLVEDRGEGVPSPGKKAGGRNAAAQKRTTVIAARRSVVSADEPSMPLPSISGK